MYVYGAAVAEKRKIPHMLQQLLAAEHMVRVGSKAIQQLQFLRRNIHLFALQFQFKFLLADLKIIKLDHITVFLPDMGLITAKHCLDACRQLLEVKGLHHIVVRPHLQCQHLIKRLTLCRQHNHRLGGLLADLRQHLLPVHLRHHDIQQDKIRGIGFERGKSFHPVRRGNDFAAFFFKMGFQDVADIRVIVYHKNFRPYHFILPKSAHSGNFNSCRGILQKSANILNLYCIVTYFFLFEKGFFKKDFIFLDGKVGI